ncbi:MAG: RNA-binding S4 domain-containing protein [Clostridiales bacterium]|nr:RNA-binding S4 domain-containing protein [Clostridiales bacterium]
MRLDKYLKVSRLIKRRTVAAEACEGTRVSVNGKPQKPSYQVKVGDIIEIRFGEKKVKIEVLAVTEHASRDTSSTLYREIV